MGRHPWKNMLASLSIFFYDLFNEGGFAASGSIGGFEMTSNKTIYGWSLVRKFLTIGTILSAASSRT